MSLLNRYLFVGLLLLVAIAFALLPLALGALVAPRKKTRSKGQTYECGLVTTGETWVRFRVQYYIYALLFVVFDIETAFLFPWAVAYGGLGMFALIEMIVFLALLSVGLIYAWMKGVLHWA
jgi:NADH-quinone oxidoreductase subunit A